MRTEQEIIDLVLKVAREDSRVRAVGMNGSRTNPNVPRTNPNVPRTNPNVPKDPFKLITRSHFSSPKELQQLLDKGMVEGFSSQLERLEDYLKAIR
ncbi:hypothetical protein DT075_35755 [Bacillus licheniformis]|nr:hypothetical protein DT075_35755 [Bacillus licheniformis]